MLLQRDMSVGSPPITPDPDWIVGKYALLNVEGRVLDARTVLEPRSWRIPFQWQGYHYQDHDDEPFLPLVNSGGGFVEGDVSHFRATLGAGTRTLITTTAASKFYKSLCGDTSKEIVDIRLGPNALLEYYPDEAIPFAHSRVERITKIVIDPSSRVFATDMISAGRIHYGDGEAFKFSSLVCSFEIRLRDKLLALDRLVATTPTAIARLPRLWRGAHHLGTVFAYVPGFSKQDEDAVHALSATLEGTELGVSRLGNLIVVRLLSLETWQAHQAIFEIWKVLRPAIAGKPARPIRKC